MLRSTTLLMIAFAVPLAIPAAEGDAQPTPPVAHQPATQPAAVATTMAKRGNVRFGPSQAAALVVTLDSNAPVEVLGVAQGMPDWYVIRFPRQGFAWMHQKTLESQDGGKTYVVKEDRARVRDDARQGANLVAELAKGEIVEAKDRARVGDWVPVYPSSAVAYVHKGLLTAAPAMNADIAKKVEKDDKADLLWQEVQARYTAFKAALDNDIEKAVILDWAYLDGQLAQVIAQHSTVRVQLAAKRLAERIAPVVKAAGEVQKKNGITPSRDVPGQPPIVIAKHVDPAADPVKPADPAKPADPTKPAGTLPKPADIITIRDAAVTAPPAPGVDGFTVQGFIEEKAFPQVGSSFVIIDQTGVVCAFLKTKPGSEIQLSEYFWRNVGVKGLSQEVDPALHNLGKKIPLILVDDVMLLAR